VYRDVYWRTDVRIASIFVSCGLYLLLCRHTLPRSVPIVAGLMGCFFHSPLFPDVVKYSIGTLLLGVSIATIDTGPAIARQILSSRPLTYMGLWSYSIYLWQQPFTKVLHSWPLPAKLALLMGAALTSYYVVELPARRYLNRIWAGRARTKMTNSRVVESGPAI
jgi:peptidoglycan/LPS O-acetylase OafA/YrhL